VIAAGELDLIPTIVANIPAYPESLAADPGAIARFREFYLAGLPQEPGRQIITDKRPENFLHIGLIKSMFPAAKIIHTIRNPLDNLLSVYFLHLDPSMAYALDLGDAAHWYGQYLRLMAHWRALYGDDIVEVEYDALVHEPERIARSLLEFLGLEWEDCVLDIASTARAVKTASVWQVREPLYTRSSGRWRNYERQLRTLRDALVKAGISSGE